MTGHPADFKRMVLGLPHSTKDYPSVAFTAELAELLGVDLVGVFAEDEGLLHLAALPCVREFRSLGEGWHRVDAGQLERGSIQAAADAHRLFLEAAKTLRVGTRFDHAKGQISDAIGSQSTSEDIIVVIEPRNPAERVTYQFRQLMDVALTAQAAALLVPSRISRRKGPIVAVATGEHDPSIQAALRVAKSVQERLLIVTPADTDQATLTQLAAESGVAVDRRILPGEGLGTLEMTSILGRTEERLVVLNRGANARLPFQWAFERGVPVLVTAPT